MHRIVGQMSFEECCSWRLLLFFWIEPKEEATYNSLHSQGSNHEFYHIIASVSLPPYPLRCAMRKWIGSPLGDCPCLDSSLHLSAYWWTIHSLSGCIYPPDLLIVVLNKSITLRNIHCHSLLFLWLWWLRRMLLVWLSCSVAFVFLLLLWGSQEHRLIILRASQYLSIEPHCSSLNSFLLPSA
jgi:hypothetical protein